MRAIDADTIKLYSIGRWDNDGYAIMRVSDVWDSIDKAPTIDAAPIVHGKWIMDANENPYIRICSICGYSRPRMNDHGFYCKINYCPTCGAKMDLKE